jgi:putative redox protein
MVTAKRKENLVVEINSGDEVSHTMIADVAQKFGGTDLGPDPHDFFQASLAACTVITVQMYANRKNWKLDSTDVRVRIDREGAQSHLVREIAFRGDLTDEQITRLMEIANKCPIHQLMTSDITISSTLVTNS